jgi:hypothetical protein
MGNRHRRHGQQPVGELLGIQRLVAVTAVRLTGISSPRSTLFSANADELVSIGR